MHVLLLMVIQVGNGTNIGLAINNLMKVILDRIKDNESTNNTTNNISDIMNINDLTKNGHTYCDIRK